MNPKMSIICLIYVYMGNISCHVSKMESNTVFYPPQAAEVNICLLGS